MLFRGRGGLGREPLLDGTVEFLESLLLFLQIVKVVDIGRQPLVEGGCNALFFDTFNLLDLRLDALEIGTDCSGARLQDADALLPSLVGGLPLDERLYLRA